MVKIFISYAHKDDPDDILCRQIRELMDFNDIVWFDRGMRGGDYWEQVIKANLVDSQIFLCLLSDNWVQSINCNKEFDIAWFAGQDIIPIKLSDFDETRLPEHLRKIHWLPSKLDSKHKQFDGRTIGDLVRSIEKSKPAKGSTVIGLGRVIASPAPFEWLDIPLSSRQISKKIITNRDFRAFVTNDYVRRTYWHYSEEAYQWRLSNIDPDWHDNLSPRVDVSWYDAMAFCHWLKDIKKDTSITLPTKDEWEAANQAYGFADDNWEWTLTKASKPTLSDLRGDDPRMICKPGNTDSRPPEYVGADVGFRLVSTKR